MTIDNSERAVQNREIAEALGWTKFGVSKQGVTVGIAPNGWATSLPDYRSLDAVANALPEGYTTGSGYQLRIEPLLAGGYVAVIFQETPPSGITDFWQAKGATRQDAAFHALLFYARSLKENTKT